MTAFHFSKSRRYVIRIWCKYYSGWNSELNGVYLENCQTRSYLLTVVFVTESNHRNYTIEVLTDGSGLLRTFCIVPIPFYKVIGRANGI